MYLVELYKSFSEWSWVAFVVFEILRNLVSMQNVLNTNNCWRKQNFENFQHDLTFIFDVLSESLLGFVSYMIF